MRALHEAYKIRVMDEKVGLECMTKSGSFKVWRTLDLNNAFESIPPRRHAEDCVVVVASHPLCPLT